ncbi:galactose ABC transporter substrate-binding protein [Clostridium beijerinckii]|jgi:monosaccharide ABC transporter substrate-binding protein, CUT2 family (TC 3.A.1.2.-)|uniref:D-galactose/methyl-galactoside binding periplasmic protein MglB n=2 Tax=Clostridium beijerinckii TaxID=1520 RepID=A0AAE2RTS1_CLOBE|nr:galactose ABC transporter substrate-binding protein [Clostridium beijerinckii]ABR35548.1 putative galactoside ABC transporter [Clostridium beijerinckii NCIMB 8052]AIU00966.1 putative galactoside ABC transporter [Clostridium beijerinckii ATCC 35702]MBF7809812.1 galactose ABC transporter substrate-binding protein [Clostridium beijerinckii]NOW90389.1 methyl-galactoside transport system substrate-binding protein [Clostridium beijerinckii]NRT69400.1 methyl-galactoside transport system substrate-
MKRFNVILHNIIITFMITIIMLSCTREIANASQIFSKDRPINVAVLLYSFDDIYISLIRQNLEEIQKENEGKIKFTFYDGKNDQSVQNSSIDELIKKRGVDLFLVNLVTTHSTQEVVEKVKRVNIPIILFSREPAAIESIKSYNKCCYVGTRVEEAGLLQGEIVTNLWNEKKSFIDKNKDNVLQYIMLMGQENNLESVKETEYPILKVNNSKIKTQELAVRACNWNEDEAKEVIKALFLQHGNRVEAIFANNDPMAIGAIKALQEYGYNKGENTPTIPVVGIEAIPEARELIDAGMMTGSVFQDPSEVAKVLYNVGMNYVYNRNPLYGTNYEFDETGISVRLPYQEYLGK